MSGRIVEPGIQYPQGLFEWLSSDLVRIRGRSGASEWLRQMLGNRAYRAVFSYRLCRIMRASRHRFIRMLVYPGYAVHRFFSGQICSEIPIGAEIGPGFLLLHGYCVVINRRAIIGPNVTIFQGVTIGASARGVPKLGARVLVAAQAIVVGPVSIGNDVTVGAGSVVVDDIPSNSIVAGNPAKLISDGDLGRAKNAWTG